MTVNNLSKKYIVKITIYLFLFFLPLFSFSQKIKGKVMDEENNPVIGGSVLLSNKETQSIVTYNFTNENGEYELITDKTGNFELKFSALLYEVQTFDVDLSSKQTIEQNAVMIYKAMEIEEVLIRIERSIRVRNDTISFLASSFLQGNEEVIEDLLKKIPGLNIDSEGTIKIGNQEIEKVMIDGDDMFDRGYKILTKNMPVNPIDKVEVLQRYSNNKHLKGVENSNKFALNLTLKEDVKNTWFGNFSLGYGVVSENRYEVRGNLMSFGKKNKHYFLTNLNNIGVNPTGNISHLIRPQRYNEAGSVGDDQSAYNLMNLSSSRPNLKAKRTVFNNAEMVSLNSIFTLSDKVKMKTLGFFNWDENDYFRNSYNAFTTNGVSFENTEDYTMRKKEITGFVKLDLTYYISKLQTLEFIGKYNNSEGRNTSNSVFNDNYISEKLKSDNELIDQKITYTNKIKDKKVLLFTARYINEKTPQQYQINQFIYEDLFSENADNIKQTSQNKMQYVGFETHLLDRKESENLWEFKLGNQFRQDRLLSEFYLFEQNELTGQPQDYQNNTKFGTNDLYLQGKYAHKFGKSITLNPSLGIHNLNNTLKTVAIDEQQNVFFVNPSLGVEWEITNKNKIQTIYSYNTTNSNILDVYDNYLHTGFRSFSKGIGEFNQLNSSSMLLTYTLGGWTEKFHLNFNAFFTKNHDFFSTNTNVDQNYSQSEKILIKNREMFTTNLTADRFLRFMTSNLKVKFEYFQSEYKNIVNGSDFRKVTSDSFIYGVEVRSGFSGIFNYHFGTSWSTNQTKADSFQNSFTDNFSFLDFLFTINNNLSAEIQTERYHFGNMESGSNLYYFADILVRYNMIPNKLSLTLSGNNLFNTKTFSNYSVSDISISKTEYRLLPRYVLLSANYRF